MERIAKGSDLPKKKSGGHRASHKNIGRSSYRKGHDQLYILFSFDSVRALEIHDVTPATSCIACALDMRSSNGHERLPVYKVYSRGRVEGGKEA